MAKREWTNPFYGVQHLRGLARGFQVTVTDRNGWAECDVFTPGCGFSAEESQHDSVAQAIEYGVKRALEIRAFA
jgi:hypothetical protein